MSVPNVNCKIQYIQNEGEIAKSPALTEKYSNKRRFYSSQLADDYLKYMDKGSKEKIDYISYSGDEEKSCGVFGKNGLLTMNEKKKLRQQLRETKSVIWDCFLTFQPEFGQRYCNDFEQAYEMMKREMPRFLKDAGFNPDNITWYAALHTNKKHRHIHISFFENTATRIRQRSKELNMLWEHQKRSKEEYGYTPEWFVFGGAEPLSDQTIRRRLNEYADKAGVKRIRVHDIRHSHASLLINKGQNILIVSQRLGHSDVTQTLNTYSHLMPNVQKQIINALDFEM